MLSSLQNVHTEIKSFVQLSLISKIGGGRGEAHNISCFTGSLEVEFWNFWEVLDIMVIRAIEKLINLLIIN